MQQLLRKCFSLIATLMVAVFFLSTASLPVHGAEAPLWVALPNENFQVAPGQYRIPLNMAEPVGVDRVNEPTRFGVPLPRGVLRDVRNVKLEDDHGKARLMQVEPAAYWPDGSYKWIIIDTMIDLPANARSTWHLTFGLNVTPTPANSKLQVIEDDERVTIDTGVLKFILLKERNEFIHAAWLDRNGDGKYTDDEQIINPPVRNETRGLFVDVKRVRNAERWRHNSGMHWAVIEPKPDQFKVEATGPVCAEIKYEGWHHTDLNADMDPWVNVAARSFKYVLRIRAYAGSSTLRVFHTFINTDDPLDTRARSIGLRLPVNLQGKPQYTFGSDSDMKAATGDEHFLAQDHWNSFSFEKMTTVDGTKKQPEILKNGEVCEGWADISDSKVGLTMVFRDMVKLFPKELGFSGNEAIAYAWPAHKRQTQYEYFWGGDGSEMDLRQPNELDNKTINAFKTKHPDLYQRLMIGSDTEWERYKMVPDRCNAIGVGKTHELLYDFHTGEVAPARARNLALAANDPIQPYVTPQWYCWATEAFGRMQPFDPTNFPAMELGFERFIQWLYRHQNEWSKLWGMFDYGDFQTFYKPEGYPEEFGPWGKMMGRYGWLNGEYNNDFEFYLSYVRTGRYTDFKVASAFARHRMDVDTCNYHPQPAWVGAQHRHGMLHWSDWLIDQQTFNDGIAALYYTTGDRRARDVALMVGDFAMYSNFPFWEDKYDGNYSSHRGTWTRLANIARAYEINPLPGTLRYIDRFIDMVNRHLEPFGGPIDGVGTGPYMGAAFPLAYRVTDNPKIKKLIEETGFTYGGGSVLGNFGEYFQMQYQFTQNKGLLMLGGVSTAMRMGKLEEIDKLRNTLLAPADYSSGRNSNLGYTYHMSAVYDAQYDDLRTYKTAVKPVAQADAHFEMLDLRPQMNKDAFGHTTSDTPLPWPEDGKPLGQRNTLLVKGGKLVFCGSATTYLPSDQEITRRLKPGQLPWTNWTAYPATGLSLPTLRRNSPSPSLFGWGDVKFDIVDSRYNNGQSMIGVRGGESVKIPVNLKARKLYFLGHVFALRYDQPLGSLPMLAMLSQSNVGSYRIHYDDGTVTDVPLINRVNFSPWIYGQAAPEAPFVYGHPGGTWNVWPGQGGVAAYELDVDPGKYIKAIEFICSDPHKELLLYAITAMVEGAKPAAAPLQFAFGNDASRTPAREVMQSTQLATEEQSGWLDATSASMISEQPKSVLLPVDGSMPTLRLRVPADGWYRVQPQLRSPHNNTVGATVFANGKAAINGNLFDALAHDGVIDLTFLCQSQISQNANIKLELMNVSMTLLDAPPSFIPPAVDPDDLVQFGWVPPTGSRHGQMRDATMRITPPPGKYRLTILFSNYPGNAGVKVDLKSNSGQVLNGFMVHGPAAVMDVTSADEGIVIDIKLNEMESQGRVQSWGLDRVELERLDGPETQGSP